MVTSDYDFGTIVIPETSDNCLLESSMILSVSVTKEAAVDFGGSPTPFCVLLLLN